MGCGVVLPNGDLLLGMLGRDARSASLGRGTAALLQQGSYADYLASDHAAPGANVSQLLQGVPAETELTKVVRLKTSDVAARVEEGGALSRDAELALPTSQLVCALSVHVSRLSLICLR